MNAKYRSKNREKCNALSNLWMKNNREKHNEYRRNRKKLMKMKIINESQI